MVPCAVIGAAVQLVKKGFSHAAFGRWCRFSVSTAMAQMKPSIRVRLPSRSGFCSCRALPYSVMITFTVGYAPRRYELCARFVRSAMLTFHYSFPGCAASLVE